MVFRQPDMTDDELISSFICQYADSLVEQVEKAGGCPVCFNFPEPQNSAAREAFRVFTAEVERALEAIVGLRRRALDKQEVGVGEPI